MTLISMMTMARSHGCIAMAGDGNAMTQRLYHAGRQDQKWGVRPDRNNCSIQVPANLFQEDQYSEANCRTHAGPCHSRLELI